MTLWPQAEAWLGKLPPTPPPAPASPRLTQRRSSSGAWAAGWALHCPGEGMVSGHGSVGCPAAQPKPGGWGAVVAEEDRMTWLTWRGTGGSQGLTPAKEGPRTQLHAHVRESAICGSLAVECRLQLTQPGGHVPANTLACPAGSSACPGFCSSHGWACLLLHSCAQKCQLIPMTRMPGTHLRALCDREGGAGRGGRGTGHTTYLDQDSSYSAGTS